MNSCHYRVIIPRASCMLDKCSTIKLYSSFKCKFKSFFFFFEKNYDFIQCDSEVSNQLLSGNQCQYIFKFCFIPLIRLLKHILGLKKSLFLTLFFFFFFGQCTEKGKKKIVEYSQQIGKSDIFSATFSRTLKLLFQFIFFHCDNFILFLVGSNQMAIAIILN